MKRGVAIGGLAAGVVSLVGIAIAASLHCAAQARRYRALETAGNREVTDGKYAAAVVTYTQLIAQFPQRPEPYRLRGIAYGHEDRAWDAVQDLTTSLTFASNSRTMAADAFKAHSLYSRAYYYFALRYAPEAMDDLDDALQHNPQQAYAHLLRAEIELSLRNYAAAITDCGYDLDHKSARPAYAYYIRGKAYAGMGDYVTAANDLAHATDTVPSLQYPWNYRGWYDYKAGRMSDAIASDRAALRLQGTLYASSEFHLGLYYAVLGDETKSHTYYADALHRNDLGKSTRMARRSIRYALRAHPGNVTLAKASGWIDAYIGDHAALKKPKLEP